MKNYELAFLINSARQSNELKEFIQTITNYIQKEGGIIKEEDTSKRALKYPIKKQLTAFLCSIDFALEQIKISQFKNFLDELEKKGEILRYLITNKAAKVQPVPPKISKQPEKKMPLGMKESEEKISLEEIDKKLEEILPQQKDES